MFSFHCGAVAVPFFPIFRCSKYTHHCNDAAYNIKKINTKPNADRKVHGRPISIVFTLLVLSSSDISDGWDNLPKRE